MTEVRTKSCHSVSILAIVILSAKSDFDSGLDGPRQFDSACGLKRVAYCSQNESLTDEMGLDLNSGSVSCGGDVGIEEGEYLQTQGSVHMPSLHA